MTYITAFALISGGRRTHQYNPGLLHHVFAKPAPPGLAPISRLSCAYVGKGMCTNE